MGHSRSSQVLFQVVNTQVGADKARVAPEAGGKAVQPWAVLVSLLAAQGDAQLLVAAQEAAESGEKDERMRRRAGGVCRKQGQSVWRGGCACLRRLSAVTHRATPCSLSRSSFRVVLRMFSNRKT